MNIQPMMKLYFQVGDEVRMPPNLEDETVGVVTDICRIFHEVNKRGEFDEDGVSTFEHTIECIAVPYYFDGDTLKILMEAGQFWRSDEVRISKHYGWACTVTTEKMNTLINQVGLRLIKRNNPWPENKKHLL